MNLYDLVIQSQLHPPRTRKSILARPRIEARLKAALEYPLTIVQAGTGYGKSTALASLMMDDQELFWYTITEPDRDPLLFLTHLICAFERNGQSPSEAYPRVFAKVVVPRRIACRRKTDVEHAVEGKLL